MNLQRLKSPKFRTAVKTLLFSLAFFSTLFLVYSFHGMTRKTLRRTSRIRDLTRPAIFNSTSTSTIRTTTRTKKKSFYEKFGLADLELLKELPTPRSRFNFTMTPRRILSENPQNEGGKVVRWSMIVVIKFDYRKGSQRDLIRKTWGALRYVDGVRLRVVFAIAAPDHSTKQAPLTNENDLYGDLLQMNRTEVYEDIGLKALAGMQWVKDNFPQDWIYSSADDDIFPDLTKLYDYIDHFIEQKKTENANETSTHAIQSLPIICAYVYRQVSHPDKRGKTKVDKETYPYDAWPPACLGAFYSMPVKLSNDILEVSRTLPYFYLDDVWFTAFLRLKVCELSSDVSTVEKMNPNCLMAPEKTGSFEHRPKWSRENFLAKWREREGAIRTSRNNVIIMT